MTDRSLDDPLDSALLAVAREAGGPLLALDTSGPSAAMCTVDWTPGRVGELSLPAAALPSESLAAVLAREIEETGLAASRLRAIVVGLGPGSFTGLRVGLATAKGLALGAGVSIYGVSSLALLAAACGPGLAAPVLDARRGELFGALYEVTRLGEVRSLLPDGAHTPAALAAALAPHAGELRLTGDAAAILRELLPPGVEVVDAPIRAGHAILHARDRILRGEAEPLDRLAPRYMRLSEAERQLASAR